MESTASQAEIHPAAEGIAPGGSLADLYVRHMPACVGLAYLMTGDRGLAEDLAQEAFIRVAGHFHHLRAREAFGSYLRRAVIRQCLSHLRRRRVERAALAREARRPRPPLHLPDLGERDELWRALQSLASRQRAAVVLRYYEDLSEQQAADVLGCSVPAVRSLVARAMESLRSRIRNGGDDDRSRT